MQTAYSRFVYIIQCVFKLQCDHLDAIIETEPKNASQTTATEI